MELCMNITHLENWAGYNETRNQRLTRQQLGAMRLAAEVGNCIRQKYPEIAEEYRNGLTAPKLVARHKIDHLYGVGREVAIHAVRNAIRGYAGHCHEPYDGLINDKSEREYLASAHNRRTGIEEYELKRGIHAMTHEQKAAAGRKSGLIWGPRSYQLRIGCHAMLPEALREHCRRIASLGGKAGGVASVAARGLVPYKPAMPGRIAELEFIFSLSKNSLFLGPIRRNFSKMAEKVNEVFYAGNPRYTRTTMKIELQSHRRRNHLAREISGEQEMLFAEELARDPAYQLPARVKTAEIVRLVNDEFHGGKPVRNSTGIRDALKRCRRRQNAAAIDGVCVKNIRS